ncbi:MAG: SLC13 family permease [Sphingomonadales bacterium]|nr:SLC13 family permease [Sphingomonadales bacterium]
MTGQQALAFAILGGAILLFAWGRFRFDLVALGALLVGMATGDVSPRHAFSGFASDVVVIIASALVVSAAIARSGAVEWAVRPLVGRLRHTTSQVVAFSGLTALLSMLTKNVGALAILMPAALRTARGSETPASALLMPMSFLSLLGGLVTLVGTSTNIIVSEVRQNTLGAPFAMFDFAPVGLTLTALGFAFMAIGWRLLPRDRQGRADLGEVAATAAFATEVRVPEALPEGIVSVADLALSADGVVLRAVVGADGRARTPLPDAHLEPGMSLVLEGDDEALGRLLARVPLRAARDEADLPTSGPAEELRTVEAVVQPQSPLVGRSAARADLLNEHGVILVGVSRAGERITERLRDLRLQPGDVLALRAGESRLAPAIAALGVLPLFARMVRLGDNRRRFLPVLILAVAIVLIALRLIPVVEAFFGAAVLMIACGALSAREAYAALEPEVLVLIGALTPLSEAVRDSGGTALIAHALAAGLHGLPPLLAVGALMLAAMACSPFLHNAPTVLVMGPIAVAVAQGLRLNPDPFLMAVATGAGCDFLTPIGHQCNTLVMGPGGYRFGDYARLGAPLSLLVLVAGTLAITLFWPTG